MDQLSTTSPLLPTDFDLFDCEFDEELLQAVATSEFLSESGMPQQQQQPQYRLPSIVDDEDDDEDDRVAYETNALPASPAESSLSTPARGSVAFTTSQLTDPRVACNNKTLLDARWPREVLEMSVVELNRYLRINPNNLSATEVKELKAARRRLKSRGYSKKLRETRRARRGQDSTASEGQSAELDEANDRIEELEQVVEQYKSETLDLQRRLEAMNSFAQKALAALKERGLDIDFETL